MRPLEIYYLNQAGRGLTLSEGIGPVYAAPLYLQRGNGAGFFFWNSVSVGPTYSMAWGESCMLRDVAYRGKILTDIAANK